MSSCASSFTSPLKEVSAERHPKTTALSAPTYNLQNRNTASQSPQYRIRVCSPHLSTCSLPLPSHVPLVVSHL